MSYLRTITADITVSNLVNDGKIAESPADRIIAEDNKLMMKTGGLRVVSDMKSHDLEAMRKEAAKLGEEAHHEPDQ